jgi:protein-tyrosine phosphatase
MSDPSPGPSETDTPDVLQQTWQALTAGQIVALPTETGYVLAAHPSHPAAIGRLVEARARTQTELFLAVRGASDVHELLPALSTVGLRLARRFWPGPLLLQIPDAKALNGRLPEPIQQALCPEGALRLRLPATDLFLHLLPVLGGPAVLLGVPEPAADTPAEQCTGAARLTALGLEPDLLVDEGPRPPRPGCTVVEVRGDNWSVVQEGPLTQEKIARHLGCLIVFVCTGNTCRSPLAEALCKKRLADRLGCTIEELPARGFYVLSAGLAAMMNHRAAQEAIAVAREYGASLTEHASRPLGEDLAAQADYLLAMTRSHLLGIDDAYPRLGCRPRLVRPDGIDISDPIGQSQAVYEECARDIWAALEPLVAEVLPTETPIPTAVPAQAQRGGAT